VTCGPAGPVRPGRASAAAATEGGLRAAQFHMSPGYQKVDVWEFS